MSKLSADEHVRFPYEDIKMIDEVHSRSPHKSKTETIRMLVRLGIASKYPDVFEQWTGLKVEAPERTQVDRTTPVREEPVIRLGLTDVDRAELGISSPAIAKAEELTIQEIIRLQQGEPVKPDKEPDDEKSI